MTMQEVMERFGWRTPQAASKFIRKHLDRINQGGNHATIRNGKWEFDETAIHRLEEIRAVSVIVEDVDTGNRKKLEAEVLELHRKLGRLIDSVVEMQEQLSLAKDERNLSEIRASNAETKLEVTERERKRLENMLIDMAEERYNQNQLVSKLQAKLERERARKWWRFWD